MEPIKQEIGAMKVTDKKRHSKTTAASLKSDSATPCQFFSKDGQKIDPIQSEDLQTILNGSNLQLTKVIEASALSMAMVTRYALGASAINGNIIGLVTNTLSGAICVATLRHLINSGAKIDCYIFSDSIDGLVQNEIDLLAQSPVSISYNTPDEETLSSAHTIISGIFEASDLDSHKFNQLAEAINNSTVPVQSILAPCCSKQTTPIYAASTLFLGLPITFPNIDLDLLGRTYLCDISLSPKQYSAYGLNSSALFSEQPVIKLHHTNVVDGV